MSNPAFILSLSVAALIPGLASDLDAAPAAPPSMSRLMYLDPAFDLRAMSGSDANTIALKDFQFVPASLTVAAGTTVSWENLDGEPHTVVSNDGLFRLDGLDQNDIFTFTFDKTPADFCAPPILR
jgi:hypothetical protein